MKKYNPDLHHRRSVRLRGYDYSRGGLYFVTVCTQNRTCLFGEITDGKIRLNEIGEIVEKCWFEIPQHYPDTALHNHIVMPNHFHGIIEIKNATVGAVNFPPPHTQPIRPNCQSRTLGAIIRGFKIGTTKNIGYSVWQRNYHEHIIRDNADYARIVDYIVDNPAKWETDYFYYQH